MSTCDVVDLTMALVSQSARDFGVALEYQEVWPSSEEIKPR